MRRLHYAKLLTAVLVLPAAIPLHGAAGESPDAYEIVAAATVPVLPQPVRAFLESHREAFRRGTTGGSVSASRSEAIADNVPSHYVMLDVAAKRPDGRLDAARRFPHDRATAERLFKQHGVSEGGSLPWALGDRYRALVRAFSAGEPEAIAREAGWLLHLATDASLPFDTTADREADAAGQRRRSTGDASARGRLPRTARERVQVGLIGYLREPLRYEVRVWPGRFEPVSDALETVFATLLDSHESLDALMKIDRDAMVLGTGGGGKSARKASHDYYKAAAVRAGSILEARLEAAVLLAANLIGGAWAEAGRPVLGTPTEAAATPPRPRRSPDSDPAPFVGSRNSTVFHIATCSHALRIKPANLVRFDTIEAARAVGRKPCKTCRPDAG